MRPNRRFLILCGLWMLLAYSILQFSPVEAKSLEMKSTWGSTSIKVDGQATDWSNVPSEYLSEQNASIAMCNDAQFLYLMFRTNDTRWAGMIRRTGLTIYLDPTGGKKKDYFIKYKGGPSREELMAQMSKRGGGTTTPAMMEDALADDEDQTPLTCFVKDRIVEKPIPPDGSEGPAAAYDTSKGFYLYEFRIPLVEDSVRYFGIGALPNKPVGVSLVWGDMGDQMKKGGMKMHDDMGGGPMGGGPGGGMGGGPGGGMGGGPGGGMGGPEGQRPNMPKKQEVMIKTTLATTPK
jgi:hypothetical protein